MGGQSVGPGAGGGRAMGECAGGGVQHFGLKFMYPTVDGLISQMELWAETILPQYAGKAKASV